jgi:hypothetical protein
VGEGLALDAAWIFAAVLLLVVLAAAALASRRYLLERGGGTVECGLRSPAESGTWRLGVASYQGDDLGWYGALGVRFRPEQVFHRRSLRVLSRRPSLPSESSVLGPEHFVVELESDAGPEPGAGAARVERAMTQEALTGFLAWLEASPPGSHLEDIALFDSERTRVFASWPPITLRGGARGACGVAARSVGA